MIVMLFVSNFKSDTYLMEQGAIICKAWLLRVLEETVEGWRTLAELQAES